MTLLTTKLQRRSVLVSTLAVWAVLSGLGCRPEKPQDHSGSSPTPLPTQNPGSSPDNRVLILDGKTASVRVPDSPALHSFTNAMTLEVWFKAASFYKRDGAVNSLLRKNVEVGGENFFLRFRIMGGKPAIEMSSGNQIMRAPYDFEPGTWYHLAGTYDGKAMTVFVNGAPVRSQPFSNPIAVDDSDLMIGKGDPNYSFGEYFDGEVDDIRIWNVARSPEQIQAAMNARLTGKEPGLVAYWTFDDGTAKDMSGNGNNGVLDGNTRIVTVAAAKANPPDAPNTPR
jgi:hypothetical protein